MRRKVRTKRKRKPDHMYDSENVARFIDYIMRDGKKSVARKIVYDALEEIKKEVKSDPTEVFESALSNVGPLMEVRSRRVGGANYQVPYEVRPERRRALSMRWIIEAAKTKKGSPMHKRIAAELVAASKNEGEAIKKKETAHKMAEANKAFAHFAWGRK